MGKIIPNTNALSKAFIGTSEIKKIYLGTSLLYQSQQQLPTPSIYMSSNYVFIQNNGSFPSGTRYNIYANGVYNTYTTYSYVGIYISTPGTYAITVIATKSGYADSNVSNTVYYTVSPTLTLNDPILYIDSDQYADVRVTNPNDTTVTCYYGTYSGSTDYSTTIGPNDSSWVSDGIYFDEWFYFHFEASGYDDSGESSIYVEESPTINVEPPSVTSQGGGGYAEIANPNDFTCELYIDYNDGSGYSYYGNMSAYDYQVIDVGSGYRKFKFYGNGDWSAEEYIYID